MLPAADQPDRLLPDGRGQAPRDQGQVALPERTLLLTCACFGALGGLLGMRAFRHKTLHKRFSWGVPAMLVFQATLLACLLIHYA